MSRHTCPQLKHCPLSSTILVFVSARTNKRHHHPPPPREQLYNRYCVINNNNIPKSLVRSLECSGARGGRVASPTQDPCTDCIVGVEGETFATITDWAVAHLADSFQGLPDVHTTMMMKTFIRSCRNNNYKHLTPGRKSIEPAGMEKVGTLPGSPFDSVKV